MRTSLLLYKSILSGSWMEWLATNHPDERIRKAFTEIRRRTIEQAARANELIQQWDDHAAGRNAAEEISKAVDRRLLETALTVKEEMTEAFVLAGMNAPTEPMRRSFLGLADRDRRHADAIREAMGTSPLAHKEAKLTSADEQAPLGANRYTDTSRTLTECVREELNEFKSQGYEVSRLVLSAAAMRRLRDEGSVNMDGGTAFDLPVEIDFAWGGHCWSFVTVERVSLAEIVSSRRSAAANKD